MLKEIEGRKISMEKRLSDKFRWFSLIMTFMIVCYHSAPHFILLLTSDRNDKITIYIKNFYETFGSYALIFFFTTSAYFFYKSKLNTSIKLKKRIKTLLIPFVLWNILYMIFFLVMDRSMICEGGVFRIVLGFSLEPFDGPLWYIPALFLYFICFNELPNRIRDKKGVVYIIVVQIIIGAVFRELLNRHIIEFRFDYYVERFIRFIPAFWFGASCPGLIEKANKKTDWSYPFIFMLMLIISTIIGDTGVTVILLYISMFSLWKSISIYGIKRYRGFIVINTFVIYAAHDAIIRVLLALLYKCSLGWLVFSYSIVLFIPIFITIAIVIISFLPSTIVNKNRFLQFALAGGRK